MCQQLRDSVTTKNSLFIFTKFCRWWKICIFILRKYADLIPVTVSKLTNPCIRRFGNKLFSNEAHSWTRRSDENPASFSSSSSSSSSFSLLLLWKIIASWAQFVGVQGFSVHSFPRPFPPLCQRIFLILQKAGCALKWDECGQINQGNAEGGKIAPFPFQYNLKWGEGEGSGRRWEEGESLFGREVAGKLGRGFFFGRKYVE